MRVAVALGGNALAPSGDAGIDSQRGHVADTAVDLAALHDAGHGLVVTHGNGPQVGALLRQQATGDAPERPLDVLVAETQAQVGTLLQRELDARIDEATAAVVTHVRVDTEDAAFDDPSKPVGPYLDADDAAARDFPTTEVTTPAGDTARRRVVASPEPQAVVERDRVRALADGDGPVVCGGGGGVPVDATGARIEGVPAVVDKDHTTRLVADAVDADVLVVATDVDHAYTDFATDDQSPIESATPAELRALLDAGEFAAGSMGPKIEACLDFLAAGGDRAVVASTGDIAAAVEGDAGTQIRPA